MDVGGEGGEGAEGSIALPAHANEQTEITRAQGTESLMTLALVTKW